MHRHARGKGWESHHCRADSCPPVLAGSPWLGGGQQLSPVPPLLGGDLLAACAARQRSDTELVFILAGARQAAARQVPLKPSLEMQLQQDSLPPLQEGEKQPQHSRPGSQRQSGPGSTLHRDGSSAWPWIHAKRPGGCRLAGQEQPRGVAGRVADGTRTMAGQGG